MRPRIQSRMTDNSAAAGLRTVYTNQRVHTFTEQGHPPPTHTHTIPGENFMMLPEKRRDWCISVLRRCYSYCMSHRVNDNATLLWRYRNGTLTLCFTHVRGGEGWYCNTHYDYTRLVLQLSVRSLLSDMTNEETGKDRDNVYNAVQTPWSTRSEAECEEGITPPGEGGAKYQRGHFVMGVTMSSRPQRGASGCQSNKGWSLNHRCRSLCVGYRAVKLKCIQSFWVLWAFVHVILWYDTIR